MTKQDIPQLQYWSGEFGDFYRQRNSTEALKIRARVAMWARVLSALPRRRPKSILEVGSNIGLNLRALRLLTDAELFALEPNAAARSALLEDGVLPEGNIFDGKAASIPFKNDEIDMVFTCGVLIHISPDDLLAACREIHRVANKYIFCGEYFSDKPEKKIYRGHENILFKRDFGKFWMTNFSDMNVVDYGFLWKYDTGIDNLTWWLFEKKA